jgi:uncharacterized membrane protein
VIAAAAAALAHVDGPVLLRTVAGIPFALFIPGYLLASALFPSSEGLDGVERIALGFGLSFATIGVAALGIEWSPFSVGATSLTVVLLGSSVTFGLVALVRRSGLASDERYAPGLPAVAVPAARQWDRMTWLAAGLALAALLLIAIGGGWIVSSRLRDETTTEFALFNAQGRPEFYPRTVGAGRAAIVVLEVTNREGREARYRITVSADGREIAAVDPFVVADRATRRQRVDLAGLVEGETVAVDFNLYCEGNGGDPYRQLRLFVDGET